MSAQEAGVTRDELLHQFPAQRGKLVASLARLVGRDEAEDMADETLLRALAQIEGFRGESALSTWLHRIGVNLAVDQIRRQHRLSPLSPEQEAAWSESLEAGDDSTPLERRQMGDCVRQLVATLPVQQRQVLALADMAGRSVAEIAHAEGMTTGNVKIRLHRARQAMRTVLETHCEFDYAADGMCACVPKSG
jgi:RNA polymerase sigma-70 factor (ECF subfamily)